MDTTVTVALITAGGVVLAALFTFLGIRFTQRAATRAAQATERLEETKVDAAAYESARDTWAEHVESLREQVVELRSQCGELRDRVDELQSGRARDQDRIHELTDYARQLLRILAQHEIPYPPPPAGLP